MGTKYARSTVDRGIAVGIDHRQLAVLEIGAVPDNAGHCCPGRKTLPDVAQEGRAQARISDVLRAGRPDSRGHVRAPRRYCRARGRDHNAELPRPLASSCQ